MVQLGMVALALITVAVGQEQMFARRSPTGSLLCPLVEDFYSYKQSAFYGPSRWGEMSECCLGLKQSPRDLSSLAPTLCGNNRGFPFFYNSSRSIIGHVYNNGHDPSVSFDPWDTTYLLRAPYTNEPYALDNIHVHFCTDQHGSEHAIDGQFFQGEIHLVHFKVSYGSKAQAVLYDDGLVVIAIMLQTISPYYRNSNLELGKLIARMAELPGVGKEFQLPVPVLVPALFPSSRGYFTYSGSMTSPPCSESVRWVVLQEPVYITVAQMDVMRQLPNENRISWAHGCNDRPLQTGNSLVETNLACASPGAATGNSLGAAVGFMEEY